MSSALCTLMSCLWEPYLRLVDAIKGERISALRLLRRQRRTNPSCRRSATKCLDQTTGNTPGKPSVAERSMKKAWKLRDENHKVGKHRHASQRLSWYISSRGRPTDCFATKSFKRSSELIQPCRNVKRISFEFHDSRGCSKRNRR